eukprot:12486093-Alexandrium_andersonii.AAC.1
MLWWVCDHARLRCGAARALVPWAGVGLVGALVCALCARRVRRVRWAAPALALPCLLYTSDAADDM